MASLVPLLFRRLSRTLTTSVRRQHLLKSVSQRQTYQLQINQRHWFSTLSKCPSSIHTFGSICRHCSSANTEKKVTFDLTDDHVIARLQDKTFHCSYFWLRDHCQCPECFDVNTNQHLVATDTVDPDIVPKTLNCTEEGMNIVWPDNHETCYPWDWLLENGPGQHLANGNGTDHKHVLWDGAALQSQLPADVGFDELLSTDEALKTLMETLYKYGIAFVCNVPPTEEDTQTAVERIGAILDTFYGKMWTFTADLAMADTAFTNANLDSHTDTSYFYEPAGLNNVCPSLQVLHCLHHDGTGGENPMVDGFRAVDTLRRNYPEHFDTLCRIPLIGQYIGDSRNLSTPYYTIALNPITHEIEHVRFNVYDRGPLSHLSEEDITAYYKAFRILAQEIRDPSSIYYVIPKPGRMMIFDNWRVLHGRKGFTGKRIMTGCYVSRCEYLNRLRTAANIRV
ncbi:trimethyllysine dioxygenase, mitochondrial-like [Amphiura filiformis]|uniref:trimethyllysine dioxygenase, mitochondrial-like n=1 Tax=Amphiura filiformis TaxID=82378 RepID=UPI003B20D94B